MDRFTKKLEENGLIIYRAEVDLALIVDKLGKLEDIMSKFHFDSLEELEELIKLARDQTYFY